MARTRTDGGPRDRSTPGRFRRGGFNPEELGRRNPNAVAMDVLYLLTTAFFGYLAMEGLWPAVIAGVPLIALLYFGIKSSFPFFVAQLLAIVVAVVAWYGNLLPL